jgi:ParB family chromosome partitioning protein
MTISKNRLAEFESKLVFLSSFDFYLDFSHFFVYNKKKTRGKVAVLENDSPDSVATNPDTGTTRRAYRKDRSLYEPFPLEAASELELEKDSNPARKYVQNLSIDILIPFARHPFKSYEGTKLNDMVESIKANGIMNPIIVRPLGKNQYEILSGHNRVKAAKEAGKSNVPATVWEDLTDDEAMLIVTETNLIQRSFPDMAHSERVMVLSAHYEAMKKKSGYRSDLIEEIEALTCDPMGTRLRTRDKIGQHFSLGGTTIARYLRINRLISELKERLDDGGIGIHVADALSFLGVSSQREIESLLAAGTKISVAQAEKLKDESSEGELSKETIEQVLAQAPTKEKSISNLSWDLFPSYFNEKQSSEEIEHIITEALKMYFSKTS